MYSGTSSKLTVSFFIFIIPLFFWGCAKESPTEPDPQTLYSRDEPWRDRTDEQRNEAILDKAREYLPPDPKDGGEGGQCKTWIQIIVDRASGQTTHLPKNYISAEKTYNKAKWLNSRNIKVVWQEANHSPAKFPDTIKPGNIIQLRWKGDHNNDDGSTGLHTALIECIYPQSMIWIDSNWYTKEHSEKVFRHVISLDYFSQNFEAWTVYQVK